jgi:hypothetical protein
MIDNKYIGKIMQKASSPIPIPSSASQKTTTPRQPSAPLSCSLPKEPSPLAQRFTEGRDGLFTPAPVPATSRNPAPASPEGYNDTTEEEPIFNMDL